MITKIGLIENLQTIMPKLFPKHSLNQEIFLIDKLQPIVLKAVHLMSTACKDQSTVTHLLTTRIGLDASVIKFHSLAR